MTQGERPAIRRAKEELAWIPRGRVVVLQSCWEEKENMI